MFKTKDNVEYLLQIIACALAVVIVVVGGIGGALWYFLGRINYDNPYSSEGGTGFNVGITEGAGYSDSLGQLDSLDSGDEVDLSGSSSISASTMDTSSLTELQNKIKSWYYNGDAVQDKSVLNILLIGMDNESADLTVNSRADAMVLVSINKSTKTITLASILRDQYAYVVAGDKARFEKLHHANIRGGPSLQIQMLERYYKVKIDNYAIVNFNSLPKVIDSLGGVTVDVTSKEASYVNSFFKLDIGSGGTTKLNGKEALAYMRIRKQDSDNARAGRQQKVILALIAKIKGYDKVKLVGAANSILPYVRTGYTSDQILSLAGDAFSNGYLNYTIKTITFPKDDECTPSTIDNLWYWTVDYPAAAQALQLLLYGQTNITLNR